MSTGRRTESLSKDRIVAAAIEILDAEGERALTFRALTARLRTGAGALYWHVADKGDLLAAAADEMVARVTDAAPGAAAPDEAIRVLALGIFDAIDDHPWVGTQLSSAPRQPGMLRIFEAVGSRVQALGVPSAAQFDCASALVNYVLGVAGQNAANSRAATARELGRTAFLQTIADDWAGLDPQEYPFVTQVADRVRDHDDREQFLAGIDLILAGIAASH
ncbi:TetR/AcrR family transcriptional regulator [Williamsia sterculiae]|uniref:Transcriptional regulator, TetR family n=1 Tax=Williamsia sterculiae TaxID=1344003 RepID=A0A1N7GP78_9NOCA|nr:TetR family transcriptional regulator [Williamsia sterculiae]SIS14394.1 transcriptional regulator, TetR family [Williamsia sterculiae]